MPIDMRSNKYPFKLNARKCALSSFELPVRTEGSVPRLWATKHATQELKQSSDFTFIHFLTNLYFKIFPNRLAFKWIRSFLNENSCVITSLGAGDASLATVSICNQSVKNIIYFYPTIANAAMSFSIMTYGDEVRLGFVADTGVISHPEFITTQFIKQVNIKKYLI